MEKGAIGFLCFIWVLIFACWKYVHSEHTTNDGLNENRIVNSDTVATFLNKEELKKNIVKTKKSVSHDNKNITEKQKRLNIYKVSIF